MACFRECDYCRCLSAQGARAAAARLRAAAPSGVRLAGGEGYQV